MSFIAVCYYQHSISLCLRLPRVNNRKTVQRELLRLYVTLALSDKTAMPPAINNRDVVALYPLRQHNSWKAQKYHLDKFKSVNILQVFLLTFLWNGGIVFISTPSSNHFVVILPSPFTIHLSCAGVKAFTVTDMWSDSSPPIHSRGPAKNT